MPGDLEFYLVFAVPVGAGLAVLLWSVWRGKRD